MPIIRLIDLFSEQQVSIKELIPMPEVFGHPGLMTEICRIEGLTARTEEFFDCVRENESLKIDEVKGHKDEISTIVLVIKNLALKKSPQGRGL